MHRINKENLSRLVFSYFSYSCACSFYQTDGPSTDGPSFLTQSLLIYHLEFKAPLQGVILGYFNVVALFGVSSGLTIRSKFKFDLFIYFL